ncbi:hypothetical protein ACHAW5_009832 [Stephanodiscus triporus]|uniref:Uncharacterized protein n=1 Tax=Stephanodiscus triporus TaxID=2934178 RepID=A0ABD3NE76_9STRA
MRFSYSSPTITQSLLGGDAGRGSPRSPQCSIRSSVHNENEGHHNIPLDDNSVSFRSIRGFKNPTVAVAENIGVAAVDTGFIKLGRRSILPRIQSDGAKTVDNESLSWPTAIVWLMSFPNSGTSYTLHTVRELTNTTTASNYGLEGDIKDEDSNPVFKGDGGMNGPYLELIRGKTTNIPKLILTKTHCGGYSYSHNPNSYIVTPRKFLR